MVFNYNIRFVRLNVVMCVFLLEDLKRFGFLSSAKLQTRTKKRRYKLDKWQNKSDKNLANPR